MAVTVTFHGQVNGATGTINTLAGSGIGGYGAGGFGTSVAVNSYADTMYTTNSGGTSQGDQLWVSKYASSTGVYVPGGTGIININNLPNYQCPLLIKVTSDGDPIRVQNAYFRVYDRSNVNNGASGVTTKVYEARHTSTNQGVAGSGNASWSTPVGSAVTLQLSNSPGISGLTASGGNLATPGSALPSATSHWYYLAISMTPDSIGPKTQYAGFFSCEYL